MFKDNYRKTWSIAGTEDCLQVSRTSGFADMNGRLLYEVTYLECMSVDNVGTKEMWSLNSECYETEPEALMAAEMRLAGTPTVCSGLSPFQFRLGKTPFRADNFRRYREWKTFIVKLAAAGFGTPVGFADENVAA